MRYVKGILPVLFLLLSVGVMSGQDIATLEKQYPKAAAGQKAAIANKLAELYLRKNGEQAVKWAKEAVKNAGSASSQGNLIKAQALNFQAKASAEYYYPDKKVPFPGGAKRLPGTKPYYEAKNLYDQSMNLAKSIGDTKLELDNIENLAYINSRKIGTHKPDVREEEKYYKLYISRIKQIKNVTSPSAVPVMIGGGGSNPSNPKPDPKPDPATSESTARLKRQNKELREKVSDLTKKVDKLTLDLEKAAGATPEELEQMKQELEEAHKEEISKITEAIEEADELVKKYKGKMVKVEGEYKVLIDEKELAEQEKALAEAKNQRFLIGTVLGSIMAAMILAFMFFAYRSQSRARKNLAEKNAVIAEEKKRSEELLLNILPANIAAELKEHGAAKARRHNDVSVFFSDFKNFTKLSEALTPEELVQELDYCFKGLDFIISQYPSIEKIKTIGDAYMCCAGLNGEGANPVADMVSAALDIQEFLFDYKADRQSKGMPFFEARIGIHTGPVVAGVVGNKKFAYDIWGDTVNVASRMESSGEVGKVNVSADTFNAIRYQFSCRPRGKINVKNKGLIEMYFVDKVYT